MTDADAMTELVRVGLRNPARVVVKVQAKKAQGKVIVEERRIPAKYALQHFSPLIFLAHFSWVYRTIIFPAMLQKNFFN